MILHDKIHALIRAEDHFQDLGKYSVEVWIGLTYSITA